MSEQTFCDVFELDELYWFVEKKARGETREHVYTTTMISREPRQIVGFAVAFDKSPERIQGIIDSGPEAENYCTDQNEDRQLLYMSLAMDTPRRWDWTVATLRLDTLGGEIGH